jgi:hypothetical protein
MKLIIIEDKDEELLNNKLQDMTIFQPLHKDGYGLVITGDALSVIFKAQNSRF